MATEAICYPVSQSASDIPTVNKPKPIQPVPRMIWRFSPAHPAGEYVLATKARTTAEAQPEVVEPWFHQSSIELSTGTDVVETEMHTLPGELVDAFLKPDR